ncbi:MAG: asparagine synthase (glutamine-hydrolyzing) [Clostridiales bacterium]|jgi:asparagine synthase (glutamine-hydrolysing)|nr:asparagine synthase (glutamine-hydrolyzing) [Clostridiales bacterium]
MCGFCGFTGYLPNGDVVTRVMSDKIAHRGPDSAGFYSDEKISVGFRRLSFIDLDSGDQPIFNETGDMFIVFNGEIYNYASLRNDLEEKGHVFSTKTDTEVILHLYEDEGAEMLTKLRGMFAFLIYDKRTDAVFIARDFFGVKPVYYSKTADGALIFASEIKSLLEYPGFERRVNETALENYLTFQYSVLDETFFKGVYKLPAAHYLIYKDEDLTIKRYWEPEFEPQAAKLDKTVSDIESVLQDSIKAHMISDVEIGAFLSSGVDSSYVAAGLSGASVNDASVNDAGGTASAKTFTVGFDYDRYNEIDFAKKLSSEIGAENYDKTITTEEYWAAIDDVQYYMDEPLADPSAVALYFVSKTAREHVKAAMSGEGADELFGGYNIYREPLDLKILTLLPTPVRRFLARLASACPFKFKGRNFFIRGGKTVEERFIGNANIFSMNERRKILKNPTGRFDPAEITRPLYEKAAALDDVTKMQYIDINLWMIGDILLKADKMSMANSLEIRVPFLDMEVFKIASKIPSNYRVNKTGTKYAFRLAAANVLPNETADKKKLGFPVPIRLWLKTDKYYNIVKDAFLSETADKYFNRDEILKLLRRHKSGGADNSRKIWTIYIFIVWHRVYFEQPRDNQTTKTEGV